MAEGEDPQPVGRAGPSRSRPRWLRRLFGLTTLCTLAVQATTVTSTLSARSDFNPIPQADAVQRLQRATVEILSLACDLVSRQGTAVAIGRDQLLTNRHVAGSARSVSVAAEGMPLASSSAVESSPVADVAVVRADSLAVEPLTLAPDDPLPGEPVRVAGYPHDPPPNALPDGLVVTDASVVDFFDGSSVGQPGPVMRLSVGITAGMSGGPVLDQAGRVAGLVFAVQSPSDNTLAIPASVLRRLLSLNDLAPDSPCG